jgi:hypothetical protein
MEEYYAYKHDFTLAIPQGDIGQSGLSSTPLKWGGFRPHVLKASYDLEIHHITVMCMF